jgi:hypothetical protein
MNDTKYIGLDVYQATISVAVLDSAGNLMMEAILETKTETILQFIHGLRGSLHVTLEEGSRTGSHQTEYERRKRGIVLRVSAWIAR